MFSSPLRSRGGLPARPLPAPRHPLLHPRPTLRPSTYLNPHYVKPWLPTLKAQLMGGKPAHERWRASGVLPSALCSPSASDDGYLEDRAYPEMPLTINKSPSSPKMTAVGCPDGKPIKNPNAPNRTPDTIEKEAFFFNWALATVITLEFESTIRLIFRALVSQIPLQASPSPTSVAYSLDSPRRHDLQSPTAG